MDSMLRLEAAMATTMTGAAIVRAEEELFAHAAVLRAKIDAAPGAFRDFAKCTADMTRVAVHERHKRVADPSLVHAALHDLIMEGV